MVDFIIITQHVSLRRWILISWILFWIAVSNGGTQPKSKTCTEQQTTTNRNSFNFRKFGNASSLEECVDFCCRDDTCELAMFSRGAHCFGVSCHEAKLCHTILDRLLMDDERELQRSTRNAGTKDFIRHTSQVANPRCPQRFVPSFHVLLLGTSTPRAFHKLYGDAGQCNAQCCRSRDCLLSFIEEDECYGVTGRLTGHNSTKGVQEPRIGLQVAIIDRNKEVSRSLDDEDEDPDELGSDDVDNGSPAAKQKAAILKPQSKPRNLWQENEVSANEGQKKMPPSQNNMRKVSFASINSPKRRNNDNNVSNQKYSPKSTKATIKTSTHTYLTTKSHAVQPKVQAKIIHSKLLSQKAVTRHDNTVLLPSKINYPHMAPLITKNTAFNPNRTLKHPPRHSNAAAQVSKRVGLSKAKSTAAIKPIENLSATTTQRQGAQRTQSKGYSKTTHDVKHLNQAITMTESKEPRRDDVKTFATRSTKKWLASLLSEGKKEGSSQDGGESFTSAKDGEFSGDDDLSGEGDLSGDQNGAVRSLNIGSGDDENVSDDKNLSGEGEDWSGSDDDLNRGDKALSSGDVDLSGDDGDLSGMDGNLSGDFNSRVKLNDIMMQPKKSTGGDKAGSETTKAVDVDDIGSDDGDSVKSTGEHSAMQNKTSFGKDKRKHKKVKKLDLVEDLDELGSDEDGSVKSTGEYSVMQNKTYVGKGKVKDNKKKKEGLLEDLDDLGSDENDSEVTSRKAVRLPEETIISKTAKNGEKRGNEHLKSKEEGKTNKTEVHRLAYRVSDKGEGVKRTLGSQSKITARKVGRLPQKTTTVTPAISKTLNKAKKEENEHVKYKAEKKKKSNLVEDLDDLGSDDDDSAKSNLEEHGKIISRKNASVFGDTDRAIPATTPKTLNSDKKLGSERLKSKEVGKKIKKIELLEDPDDLGADDDDSVGIKDENNKMVSRKVGSLPQRTNRVKSKAIKNSKKALNTQPKSKSGNLHFKSREKNKKQVSDTSGKVISKPEESKKKSKNISSVQSRLSHKANPGTRNESSRKKEQDIKAITASIKLKTPKKGISEHHITSSKERTTKHRDKLKQPTIRPLTSTTEEPIKQSALRKSSGQSSKPKANGTKLVDHSVEPRQSNKNRKLNGIDHRGKTIQNKKHTSGTRPKKATKVSQSMKKLKPVAKPHSDNSKLKDKVPRTGNIRIMIKATERKNKSSMKDRILSTKRVKSTSEVKLENHRTFASKKGGIKSFKSSPKLEDMDDLMKYAHRKVSAKHKSPLSHYVGRFVPSAKPATLGKTTPPQQRTTVLKQGHKKRTNRNNTMQGQHPTMNASRNDKSSHARRPPSTWLKEKGKVAAENVQTTPNDVLSHILSTTRNRLPPKKNHSLPSHPTFSPKLLVESKGGNLSAGNHSNSNKALLSIKQRSNDHILEAKDEFLAHFHKDSNGSDGVDFSVKSDRKHHRRKHSKHVDSIDVEDLGDADFDIMMSNDIPHKDLPKKEEKSHKHKEKQRDTEANDRRKDSKKKQDDKRKDDEEDGEESEKKSATRHSSHRHKDRSKGTKESVSGWKHRHRHHETSEHGADSDDEDYSSKHEDNGNKHKEKESHHHSKHDESENSADQKESEREHHHEKHNHQAKNTENDDDNNSDSSDGEKTRIHKHKKKHHNDVKHEDDSEKEEETGSRRHHRHKTHAKKYDNNNWVGKIIPGKVKLTYERGGGKKRHHRHKTRDENGNADHKPRHSLEEQESRKDSSEPTESRKSHRHFSHKHYVEGDAYRRKEKLSRRNKSREDHKESKNTKDEDSDEKQDHAEKRTDVNYEAIKTGRHSFVHHGDEEGKHHHEEQEHRQRDEHDEEDNSSKSENDDKNDDSDESGEEDRGDSEDSVKEEEHPSEKRKGNRVVLGEDSEDDDEDNEKHSEEGNRRHHGHRHGDERHRDERNDIRYHSDEHKSQFYDEHYKSTAHNRHKHVRHWEPKPRHHKPNDESEEGDNDYNAKEEGRNFRKSFIYHKKKYEHHDSEKNREEQESRDADVNYEHNNEGHEMSEHHRHSSLHHRHYHHRPRGESEKKEKYEERYEPDEPVHLRRHHQINEERPTEESEHFRRHHQMTKEGPAEESEHHYWNFPREKESHHAEYVSHEDDRERWKFKEEHHNRDFQGASDGRDNPGSYEHRFMGDDGPRFNHFMQRPVHDKRRKFKPRHRQKRPWKNRYHYHDRDDQGYEDSGGSFDASSWIPNENYDDDSSYGGEGNHNRKRYRKKHHRKYKHRKDRQSYEYWGYGEQNPYYYNYKYHKYRPQYENYPLQPSPPLDWHNSYKGYDRWKLEPRNWYPDTQHWDRKGLWKHHPTERQYQENRPMRYQWNKHYSEDGNGVGRFANQPKPTSFSRDPSAFLRPTNPRWQQLDGTEGKVRGNNWRPEQNRGPGKQYLDWSENRPSGSIHHDENTYSPQQHPPYGLQPGPNPDASKADDQMQPTGIQSKYVPPAPQQNPAGVVNQTKFRPTVRRQFPGSPPAQVSSPSNTSQIQSIMDKLNSPSPATGGQQPKNVPPVQNNAGIKNGPPKNNLTNGDQNQSRNRLNGFFNEENGGKKKSEILRPTNSSNDKPTRNSSSANTSQHAQQTIPKTTLPPTTTQAKNTTTTEHTTPMKTTSNHTRTSSIAAQNSSKTAVPTSPAGPDFGDVSQPDDSPETGTKHRKHRAPVCNAGKTTDDVTLLRGKRAGNFTNIGDVGDFGMCIKRCCQQQKCDLAFKSAETCFLVSCFSQESCQTSPSLDDIFSPRMCFVKRHLRDSDKDISGEDGDDDWNDKVSPSGIHEVCEAEKALGIFWKKTVAGHYSTHPCPRQAKGFVKRRCEADSRWLPPNFSDCVSSDYQDLYDKSRKLASGADPSPLIRELSQLTTQNIDNSLIFGGDLDRATDIMAAIVQHNGQTDLLDMTSEDVENFVRASSNLLDMTNQQEWFNIQKNKPGTADVLRSMEMFALQAAMRLPREDMAEPTITSNIIIKMDRKSPGDGGLTFPDFSNPRVERWDARHDVIALPSSVFDRGEISTASISFKSLPYLLPDSNVSTGLGPNSKVISTVMHPHPQGKITPPVTVVLSHIKRRRGNPKCVFWDYTLNPHRGGAWSSRGCWLAFNNQSHSICQCSHLSNFAVLMDLSADESLQKEQKRERTMALMWIGIPVLIVGVIGGLYMSFSWNRKSGMPSTVTRPSTSLNEKTGLLGQRVVTSQVREEFPPSPTRDLYRALSPGYSPTGDLEWQDEFDFDVESGDHGFKQMLLPKLQLLQNQLINEFYDADKLEMKKKLLESKIQTKPQITVNSQVQDDSAPLVDRLTIETKPQFSLNTPVQCETNHVVDREKIKAKPQIKTDNPIPNGAVIQSSHKLRVPSGKKLRVRFADESPPGRNRTDEDKERFKRLQQMERRVFAQHLSRWTANSHLNLSE